MNEDITNIGIGYVSDIDKKHGTIVIKKFSTHQCEWVEINGKLVEIDVEMVDVIRALNKIGLKTRFCCQNRFDKGYYYITLETKNVKIIKLANDGLVLEWNRLDYGDET